MINDANILLSYINTKLRDEYASLEELLKALSWDGDEVARILNGAGYYYDAEKNRFE